MAQTIKNLPAVQEAQVQYLGYAILWNSVFSWVFLSFSLVCLLLLFLFQLFVKPPQPFGLLAFLFLEDGFGHCLLYSVKNLCP